MTAVANAEFLTDLIAFSARIGAEPLLVQGGGGNTSLKRDDELWVKASGTWLAQARERELFVRLPLSQVRAALRHDDAEDRIIEIARGFPLRPSIETSLHALLPQRVVAHVHSVNTLAWAVRTDARKRLQERLGEMNWAWVPYRRPGHPLTCAVADAIGARAPEVPDVLVLANHGLVVAGEDCAQVAARLDEVERRLMRSPRAAPASQPERLRAANDLSWQSPADPLVHALASDAVARAIAADGVLYPDHAVFLGACAAQVGAGERLSQALERCLSEHGAMPAFALVEDAGVLVAPGLSAGAQAMLHCLALLGLRLNGDEPLARLGADEVAALVDWDAEAYRRALARSMN
ncbi:class II aldolase/adducin family protein [Lysobacter sp. BMK333-48F3]|uniref:class II aldolase/adducin family protein n=1 Tax=Lysobacter sp. BMK333-48F3 TaxID=2867962 RepID=UPI001C8CD00F|nr:class II aldolase/adducin family protein [Lysobacter sp. BMK333-48F3]